MDSLPAPQQYLPIPVVHQRDGEVPLLLLQGEGVEVHQMVLVVGVVLVYLI